MHEMFPFAKHPVIGHVEEDEEQGMRLSHAIEWSNHFKSHDGSWYGWASVRVVSIALLMIAACGGGGGYIQNLPLQWRGVDNLPRPSASVGLAFAASPLSFGLRDLRPDPSVVGTYAEDGGFAVRTIDNVGQYCTDRVGEMLVHAGARLTQAPVAALEAELLDYLVVEGGTFVGTVRIRAIVHRSGGADWSKIYVGTSKRWGRTHNPENFNEALSNALADVTSQLVQDEDFARSLVNAPAAGPTPPPAPPPPPGSSRG